MVVLYWECWCDGMVVCWCNVGVVVVLVVWWYGDVVVVVVW